MSKATQDLASMANLTAAAYMAAQARMATLKSKEAALRQTLADLSASRRYDSGDVPLSDPARRAGADLLWQRWVDSRRTTLNLELVNVLVAQAQAKVVLAKTFGRNEAIKGLQASALQKARAENLRRAERNGY
jgi:hypothetical protein